MEGESFHKSCFKCARGGCHLTHSNYAALDGILYCKVHFQQLFMEKGNYQHVLEAAAHKKSGSEDDEQDEAESAEHETPKEDKVDETDDDGKPDPEADTEADKAQEQS